MRAGSKLEAHQKQRKVEESRRNERISSLESRREERKAEENVQPAKGTELKTFFWVESVPAGPCRNHKF